MVCVERVLDVGIYGVLRYDAGVVVVSPAVGEVDSLRVLKETYTQTSHYT